MVVTDSVLLVMPTELWSMYLSCSIDFFSSAPFGCFADLDMYASIGFIPSIFHLISVILWKSVTTTLIS